MKRALNHPYIHQYCKNYTEKIVRQAFASKTRLTGAELLEITPIKQINLLIIKGLFTLWEQETQKLRSPYFDYQNPEVRQALKSFLNVLSRHIQIQADDLRPLLSEAVRQSLLLITVPYDFFNTELAHPYYNEGDSSKLEILKKYIKINRHYLEALENAGNSDIINQQHWLDSLKRQYQDLKNQDENQENWLPAFSQTESLDAGQLFVRDEKNKPSPRDEEHYTGQKNPATDSKPAQTDNQGTINERFDNKNSNMLVEKLRRQRVEDLKKSMSINQRFMFVNTLFHGDVQTFDSTILFLNQCPSREDAMDFIEKNCFQKLGWDIETEEVQEFLDMLDKLYPI
ncbi:MAG: hypothetical protein JJU28_23060 [Cyclobacteriaceae bacterium]|nr:hypothetical protein [Cyclobacteriaceae bacterium]